MNDDREKILQRVRGALGPIGERAAYPEYDSRIAVRSELFEGRDLWTVFGERLEAVNGIALRDPEALVSRLRAGGWMRGYCDPDLWERLRGVFGEGFEVETVFERERIDEYAFGITRAAGAVAESGTVILNDQSTLSRLAALAPWVHVAVFYEKDLLRDLTSAAESLGEDPNVVWVTGPSKTADVEGILIEGVHGPGVQIALMLAGSPSDLESRQ